MEEVEQRVHLPGTDLLGRSSSPSPAAAQLEGVHDRRSDVRRSDPTKNHRKNLLEEFNSDVRRSDPAKNSTSAGASGGKRNCLAAEGTEQLVSGGIPAAARSGSVAHGPKPADIERDGQEMVDSARLYYDHTINSDQMAFALGSDVPEREEEEGFSSEANEEVVSIYADPAKNSTPAGASGGKRKAGTIPLATEGTEQLVSGGVPAAARSANVVPADVETDSQDHMADSARLYFDHTINSDHMAAALGSDDVPEREQEAFRSASSEEDQVVKTHVQVPTPAASGKACDGDEETGPDCSAAEPSGSSSSPSSSSDTDDGDGDHYNLGVAAAMAMDEETLRSEVARYFCRQAYREQRPQRRAAAAQRNAAAVNPAPPMKFSLRLSRDEAMEDVAALSVANHVRLEDALPALPRNAKRRRGS